VLLGLILGIVSGSIFARYGTSTGGAAYNSMMLSFALTITILALSAPHIDRWLSRLTSLKTSVVEIQLASISTTTRTVQAGQRQAFYEDRALASAAGLADIVKGDISFIDLFESAELRHRMANENANSAAELKSQIEKLTRQREQLDRLHGVFDFVVSPLAKCIQAAMNHGLNLSTAQAQLRPAADHLLQIMAVEAQLGKNDPGQPGKTKDQLQSDLSDLRTKFWDEVQGTPKMISNLVDPKQRGVCDHIERPKDSDFTQITEYKNLPQLYEAMSFLLMFVNNAEAALQMLENARAGWDFDDLSAPYLRANLMYYRRDSVGRYFDSFKEMR
jgi:hypothetical protein